MIVDSDGRASVAGVGKSKSSSSSVGPEKRSSTGALLKVFVLGTSEVREVIGCRGEGDGETTGRESIELAFAPFV